MITERVLSISSVVIAVCAVCVSLWQGIVAREHNKLSLKPYFASAPRLPGIGGENGVFLSNHGGGPAFITKATIRANGKTFDLTKNSWPNIYDHLGVKKLCYYESWIPEGTAIKGGQNIKLLAPTSNPLDPDCPLQFIKLLSVVELNLFLEYESVYEDTFTYTKRIGMSKEDIATYRELLDF